MRRRALPWAIAGMLTASTSGVLGLAPIAAMPAYAAPSCNSPPPPGQPIGELPWPQRRFVPDRISPFADGSGVTVAVVDSGVDSRHPQLAGRVLRGSDFLAPGADGRLDCKGHGTGVASIIAGGTPPKGTLFRGLAPGAKILPVRVSEKQDVENEKRDPAVTPEELGEAIRWAVQHDAKVVNLSVVLYADMSAVRSAVEYAIANDVVVVAAAGNYHDRNNPRPYPASYDGVLGVGAIGPDGLRQTYSQVGPYVDLVGPGGDVVMAAPGGGYRVDSGTSYAAPYVAATAALVRDRWPQLPAKDVVRRIIATADPAAGGGQGDGYGGGVVNPYRAVTETVAQGSPERLAPLPAGVDDPATRAQRERQTATRRQALALAAAGAAAAGLALVLAVVIPRGARRRWRSAEPA